MALTKKQQRFVEEYLIDLNATQAAIRAGYSTQTARQMGVENLSKPVIKNAIDKELAERSRRTGVNADRVIREIAKIAFVNPANIINFDSATVAANVSPDDTAAIAAIRIKHIPTQDGVGVEREIRFVDKSKALELLGKHLGLFTDKVKFEGALPVVITGDGELEE